MIKGSLENIITGMTDSTTALVDEYAESPEKLVALNKEMDAMTGEDFMRLLRYALLRCAKERGDDTVFGQIGERLKKAYAEKDETEIGRLIVRMVFLYQGLLLFYDVK